MSEESLRLPVCAAAIGEFIEDFEELNGGEALVEADTSVDVQLVLELLVEHGEQLVKWEPMSNSITSEENVIRSNPENLHGREDSIWIFMVVPTQICSHCPKKALRYRATVQAREDL